MMRGYLFAAIAVLIWSGFILVSRFGGIGPLLPADVIAIDQSGSFRGFYFLLLGHLSPIDGIGPEEIGADLLDKRLAEGEVTELVIATGTTVEGEATAHYLSEMARRHGVVASRIAHGVPMGGDLEYVDSNTLTLALQGRRVIE